jgi:hypothetical protein
LCNQKGVTPLPFHLVNVICIPQYLNIDMFVLIEIKIDDNKMYCQ